MVWEGRGEDLHERAAIGEDDDCHNKEVCVQGSHYRGMIVFSIMTIWPAYRQNYM